MSKLYFGEVLRQFFSKKTMKAIGWTLLIAWLAFLARATEDILALDMISFVALLGLIIGICAIVLPKFITKVREGEFSFIDFNPWYVIRSLPVFQILWALLISKLETIQPGATVVETFFSALLIGLAAEEIIAVVWRLLKIWWGHAEVPS